MKLIIIANVPGSDPYWFQRTGELESTFEQLNMIVYLT
jgi:hypothetical protein